MKIFRFSAILLVLISLAAQAQAVIREQITPLEPMLQHSKTTAEIVSRLRHQHYQRTSIFLDDKLSSLVLDRYLKELDENRSYFLADDIAEFDSYRFRLDELPPGRRLQGGQPAPRIQDIQPLPATHPGAPGLYADTAGRGHRQARLHQE